MQLKVDENISRRGVELLKTAGHDVTTVVEQGLQGASDEAVLDAAADEKRVLVTLDRGFGQILPRAETGTPGIVVLECGKQTTQRNLLKRLEEFVAFASINSPAGTICIVEPGRVRIHVR